MAKGKRPTKGKSTAKKEKKFDGGGSRVKAVNTWDEMEHDSEDEFHDSRSAILLDHEKELQSRYNDDSEGSEEEVFGLDEEEEEEEEDEDDLGDLDGDFGDADDADEPDLDKVSWGKSKRSYYNAEEVESDEETAKAEEEEALRLQKKRLAQMSEEDFAPEEEDAWGAAGRGALGDRDADRALVEGFDRELAGIELLKADQGGIIVEKIAKAGASKLSKQEIMKVLQNQSPELVDLVEEFKEKSEILQALAEVLQMVAALPKPFPETQAPLPFLRLKYSTLINYLTNIAFYITLKTTPNAESVDLRDHPVIDALLELKTSIGKLEKLEGKKVIQESMEDLLEILETGGEDESESEDDEDEELRRLEAELAKAKKAAKSKKEKKSKTGKKDDAAPAKEEFVYDVEFEDDFVSYNDKTKKGGKKTTKSISASKKREQLDNDYGDLDELLDVDLEDKAQKKRSLRDYVSKIDQKSNKRSKILKGSGDSDIPYREKFKDRQEQMKRQAAKSAPEPENTELDDLDWDAKDKAAARHVGGDGNDDDIFSGEERSGRSSGGSMQVRDGEEYYEQVLQDRESKKAARKALNENIEQSTSFEDTNIDPNDKRSVTWQILKNKGLTPHRKKEQRNPRVKNRKKYETAKKKIKSVKRVFTRLEGAYGGEKTGIKTGLARSVKFS